MYLKQGDGYSIPISITTGGAALNVAEVEKIEVCIGSARKEYPGDITFSSADGCIYVPVTQSEMFAQRAGDIMIDVRVRFVGGAVLGCEGEALPFLGASSEEAL